MGFSDKIYYLFSDKVNIPIDKNDIPCQNIIRFFILYENIYNNNELKVIWENYIIYILE